MIRIVDRNLTTRRHPTRNDNNPLLAAPKEFLKLAVRATRMIDEAGKIAHLALVDLIPTICRTPDHDIESFNAVRNQADEFSNRCTSIEVLWLSVDII